MANSLPKKLARNAANAWMWKVELPRAYRESAQRTAQQQDRVLLIEEDSQYLPPQLEAVFNLVEAETSLDVEFVAIARKEGIGWEEFRRRVVALMDEVNRAKLVITPATGDIADFLANTDGVNLLKVDEGQDPAIVLEACSHCFDASFLAPKPPADQRMARLHGANAIDLSIVVPAYNAERTIQRAVESVASQPYDTSRLQLIVVNDGSTDSTAQILESLQARYPGLLTVITHAAPSGSPAAPRNRGLAEVKGEYVFFLDADDWFGPEAIPRMLGHALDWHSDILMAKIVGENGRHAPASMFKLNQPNANIWTTKVMWTLAPYRLYRRDLIHDLRFPETYMPEDIPFVLSAMNRARIVSVAADYDYYHLAFDGDGNASFGIWKNIPSCMEAYRHIFPQAVAMQGFKPGNFLARRLLKVDVCRTLCALETELPDTRMAYYDELCKLAKPLYAPDVPKKIGGIHGELIEAALNDEGSWDAVRAIMLSSDFDRNAIYDEPKPQENGGQSVRGEQTDS